jgi:hypothetical protein
MAFLSGTIIFKIVVILVSVFLFTNGLRQIEEVKVRNIRDNGCDLACWLSSLTIYIPNANISKEGFTFSLKEMTCNNLQLGGIQSEYIPPTSLNLSPFGVGMNCSTDWSLKGWGISTSGSVTVTVSNSTLNTSMILEKAQDGLAEAANLTQCKTAIHIEKISFSGGFVSDILELFRKWIASYVEGQLETVICNELKTLVNTNLTYALQEIDDEIRPYLHPHPPYPAPPVPQGMVNFLNNTVVNIVGWTVHAVLGSNGLLSLNTLVDKVLPNGTLFLGTDELSKATNTIPIMDVGNITIGLLNFTATGLDTWQDLSLYAVSNYSLGFHSELQYLKINTTFFVNVTSNPKVVNGRYLYEEGMFSTVLKRNNMNVTMQLALKECALKELEISQFQYPKCLQTILYGANMTDLFFNMSVEELHIQALGGDLEDNLDKMIDHVLALFTNSFSLAIPAFFNRFVSQALETEVEEIIEEAIMMSVNGTCPSPLAPAPVLNKEGTIYAFASAGILFLAVAVLAFLVQWKKTKLSRESERFSLAVAKGTHYSSLSSWIPKKEEIKECLALHPNVPLLVRFGIPLLLLGNIATFLSSNMSMGATVFMLLTAGMCFIPIYL